MVTWLRIQRSLSRRSLLSNRKLHFIILAFFFVSLPYFHFRHQDGDNFTAIGRSSQYPDQWERGKVDPFFGLILAGNDDSPGQNGEAVIHDPSEIEVAERRFKQFKFDVMASDKIPLDRRVRDLRLNSCKEIKYDEDLPKVSVIIIFYNEAPSVILRTVVSVLNRSPHKYLHEIILVDDHSELTSLEYTFPKALKLFLPPKVKLIRNRRREGLIRTRLVGAAQATGEVLLFLDSHCEVGPGYLEPLLQRIKEDYRNIAMPSHDAINPKTFEFVGSKFVNNKGSFNWELIQTWKPLPKSNVESP